MDDRVDDRVAPPTAAEHPGLRTKTQLQADIRQGHRCVLVVNTRSRRGRRLYGQACRLLKANGLELLATFAVAKPGRLDATLAAALRFGPDLLVVGGGDGTLATAVRQLAYQDTCLGVLPLGTTNNVARSLGIPLGVAAAVRVLGEGKVADVDLGRVGERVFANLLSLGVSVEVAGRVPPVLKRLVGRGAYPMTALRVLSAQRPFRASITVGDQRHELETYQLNIANGRFHAGRVIAADASIDDRALVVYQLGTASRARLVTATIRHVVAGPRSTITDRPFLTARDLWLDADPPQPLDLDGEVCGRTPVRVSVAAEALRVMVPTGFLDT